MDEYYDDDFSDETWNNQKKSKKVKTNPAGPYEIEFMFKGVNWNIVIENISMTDFKVTARSDKKIKKEELIILKRYLQDEGFEMAAKKHNLFW
jgi:hypothetical protein